MVTQKGAQWAPFVFYKIKNESSKYRKLLQPLIASEFRSLEHRHHLKS